MFGDTGMFGYVQPEKHLWGSSILGDVRAFWIFRGNADIVIANDGNNMGLRSPYGRGWSIDRYVSPENATGKRVLPQTFVLVSNTHQRLDEYGGERSQAYLRALEEELFPAVEDLLGFHASRRISLGSSRSGTATIEALVTRGDFWHEGIAMSPTLRAVEDHIYPLVENAPDATGAHRTLYLDVGKDPSEAPAAYLLRMAKALERKGIHVVKSIIPKAPHNEVAWGARVPRAFRKLEDVHAKAA